MRALWFAAACALVSCNSKKEWKTKTDLTMQSSSSVSPYQAVSDLDDVQPALIVEGEGALRTAVETKLKAAGAGKDGRVKVQLGMPGRVSGDGTLDVQVSFEGSWGEQRHHTITGAIAGTIAYESSGGASDELTAAIADKLADEVLKSLAKEKPKHAGPPKPPTPAIAVGIGLHMSCSLHKDGTVRCWGGRTSTLGPVPFPVANVEGAVEIAIGSDIGCARLGDGTVRCWDSARWTQDAPVWGASAVCGVDGVVALSRGEPTCALKPDGSVVCWGSTGFDEGCAQNDAIVVPKLVATKVATSFFNACAIDGKGQVACWEPCRKSCRDAKLVLVKHLLLAGATELSVGGLPCAIIKNEVVRCERLEAKEVVEFAVPGAIKIANEFNQTFVITKDHQLWARDKDGKLAIAEGAHKATDISASPDSACLVNEAGEVWCTERDTPFARVVYAKP